MDLERLSSEPQGPTLLGLLLSTGVTDLHSHTVMGFLPGGCRGSKPGSPFFHGKYFTDSLTCSSWFLDLSLVSSRVCFYIRQQSGRGLSGTASEGWKEQENCLPKEADAVDTHVHTHSRQARPKQVDDNPFGMGMRGFGNSVSDLEV